MFPAHAGINRKLASPGDIRHLDEVRIVIHGQPHWLWRAVDHEGYILDEILQTRRNTKAAKASADQTSENGRGPAQAHGHRQTGLLWRGQTETEPVWHLSHKGLNKRAENAHLPL